MAHPEGARGVVLSELSRRRFLLGVASALTLTACGPKGSASSPGAPVSVPVLKDVASAGTFFTRPEFFIAHRGSYDNWPEHTMRAYAGAVAAGAEALEISVNSTSDGILVCHHDPTTERNADRLVTIAQTTYAELEDVRVDARKWLGPKTPTEPIPQLKEVLDAFAASRVLLIEDKQGDNTEAILDMMDGYPDAKSHLVWKQWAGAGQWQAAKDRGYLRWGFFTEDLFDRVDELATRFDFLGVPTTATDVLIKKVVAAGRPVIAYEVHTRAVRERMASLGVQGMMCSNYPYVTGNEPPALTDAFGTGLRPAGDLPWTTAKGSSYQPVTDVLTASLSIGHHGIQSYSMGSMCPIETNAHTLSFDVRWPDELPDVGQHVGVAFGLDDDRPYRVLVPSELGGYHMIIRSNGIMELFRRAPGSESGVSLGSRPTGHPTPGQWMTFEVTVTPERVRILRKGLPTWQFEVDDVTYRGGYFSLCKNYAAELPVEFRSISIA
ncbi:MAG: glycerophosphodiester phosphodiesterase [Janthinobacterium lividum]